MLTNGALNYTEFNEVFQYVDQRSTELHGVQCTKLDSDYYHRNDVIAANLSF